jgi:peptidoglycan lytic transglycosylase
MKMLFVYTLIAIFTLSSFRTENAVVKNNATTINNDASININDAATTFDDAATTINTSANPRVTKFSSKVLYGTASYYANSFVGKQTSNGEIFSQKKLTGASNFIPLDTWVKVTNLRNGKSVVVKITDRMHKRMKRVIDLTRTAAGQLSYINDGLTKVKVEPLGKSKPAGA